MLRRIHGAQSSIAEARLTATRLACSAFISGKTHDRRKDYAPPSSKHALLIHAAQQMASILPSLCWPLQAEDSTTLVNGTSLAHLGAGPLASRLDDRLTTVTVWCRAWCLSMDVHELPFERPPGARALPPFTLAAAPPREEPLVVAVG
jgi:hypothetical protein